MTGRQRVLSVIADAMAANKPMPVYKVIAFRAGLSLTNTAKYIAWMRNRGKLVTHGTRIMELRLSANEALVVLT